MELFINVESNGGLKNSFLMVASDFRKQKVLASCALTYTFQKFSFFFFLALLSIILAVKQNQTYHFICISKIAFYLVVLQNFTTVFSRVCNNQQA